MCYGGGPPSLTVSRLLDTAGWPRLQAMPCHNGNSELSCSRLHTSTDFFFCPRDAQEALCEGRNGRAAENLEREEGDESG